MFLLFVQNNFIIDLALEPIKEDVGHMAKQVLMRCVPWHLARDDDRLLAVVDGRAFAGVAKVLGDGQVNFKAKAQKAKANRASTKSGSLHIGGSPTTKAPRYRW